MTYGPPPRTRAVRRALGAAADRALPSSVLIRRVRTARREIAITFDDGPDDATPDLLSLLAALRAKTTFFWLGEALALRKRLGEEVRRQGHEVASHGYAHRALPSMSHRQIAWDLCRTQELLPPPGRTRPLFRPPRGALSFRSFASVVMLGYTVVLWSFDSLDHRHLAPRELVRRFDDHRFSPGDIVLLHEGEKHTRAALPDLIGCLRRQGLEPVTISHLATRKRDR